MKYFHERKFFICFADYVYDEHLFYCMMYEQTEQYFNYPKVNRINRGEKKKDCFWNHNFFHS